MPTGTRILRTPSWIASYLPFEEFCDEIPREVWDFYRGAHFKALRAALAEVQDRRGQGR